MRNITKIRRSIRAISPVISILLMIAIAVVASIVAYAWVMGYLGFQTEKAGNEIQIQSYTSGGNLVIYVQNTGEGVVHLKQDGSVYVNDVLKEIVNLDDIAVAAGAKMPIAMGQTVKVEVDYQNFQAGDKIKVVTVEGTVIDFSGHNTGSGSSSSGSNGPSAGFIFSPASPVINAPITFTDKSIAGSSAITQWLWTFGEGTPTTSQNSAHTYTTSGDKTISLTVTDSNGRTSTATRTINIASTQPTITGPIAEFTITNIEPLVNQNVPFKDDSIAGSGAITQWAWTFGDGGVSSEQNPMHAYSTVDTKIVTLTVTDSNAKTSTVSHTLTVVDPTQPTPTPTNNPSASPTPTSNPSVTPTPTPTATPTPTPTASPSPTPTTSPSPTPNQNIVFSTGFDNTPWDEGWDAGNNPPFYRAAGEGVGGTVAAKSDPYTTNGVPNDGAFTSDEVNTNINGATTITVTFMYKVHLTESTDLKIAYSTIHNPNLDTGSRDFNYVSNFGRPVQDDVWYSGSYTILKSQVPSAFTSSFSFRFESNLDTQAGGDWERIWIDNVAITVS
jgi:PKD repeat protein